LNDDEQIDLVALTWLGRGDGDIGNWGDLRAEAARAHNKRTAAYLLGKPMLADHLEEALSNSAIHRKNSRQIYSDRNSFVGKLMPYRTNIDLPASVRDLLPSGAQDIYRPTFNHALTTAPMRSPSEPSAISAAAAPVLAPNRPMAASGRSAEQASNLMLVGRYFC
jgi:hypothetical protein